MSNVRRPGVPIRSLSEYLEQYLVSTHYLQYLHSIYSIYTVSSILNSGTLVNTYVTSSSLPTSTMPMLRLENSFVLWVSSSMQMETSGLFNY